MLEHLPKDILFKIFDTMSLEELVRLEGVSSTMQSLVRDKLTKIVFRHKSLNQLAAQYAWLHNLAESHPSAMHTLHIHPSLRQLPRAKLLPVPGESCWI